MRVDLLPALMCAQSQECMDVDNVALLVIPAYCLWQIRNANMAHKLISTLKLAYTGHQMTSLARRPWELNYSEQHHVQPRRPQVHHSSVSIPINRSTRRDKTLHDGFKPQAMSEGPWMRGESRARIEMPRITLSTSPTSSAILGHAV